MSARRLAATLLPLAGCALAPIPAYAQEGPPVTEEVPPPERDDGGPADRFGVSGDQLQVSSGTEDNSLTFRVALPSGPAMASRFALTVATPLHDGDDLMPSSLDALANGTRATLSWGYFDVSVGHPDAVAERIAFEARRECRRKEPGEIRCRDSGYATNKYRRSQAARAQRHRGRGATDYGLDASVGFNDFEWIDATSFLPQKRRHTDWSVAGHVAHYISGSHTALIGSVAYQSAYEASPEQLLCPPDATDPATECQTGRAAAPARNENLLIAAGLRHRFLGRDGLLRNLAISPLVTYDALDEIWGVDVPVYFVADKDGKLNGGIRFGYRSDRENKFSIGLFVGTTFSVFQ